MSGAHLDSVPAGPGINDNGSGSAALLELAQQLGNYKPREHVALRVVGRRGRGPDRVDGVRGRPEPGRTRPDRAVHELRHGRLAELHPHGLRRRPVDVPRRRWPIPPGSTAIEDWSTSQYYTLVGEPYDDTEFSGRSDYQAFIEAGIPSGGLFTGAEEEKTAQQQAIWGGTTGAQLDPCYHLACDTFANNNDHALDVNSDLIAFAELTFAYSTQSVNGVKGKDVPDSRLTVITPNGPEGTFTPVTLANGRWLSYVPAAIDRFDLPQPDYEADDVLVVTETEQLRALADDVRLRIVAILRERAATTTELAENVGLAKGTVAHHLKVLESAGLVKVVRTRRVRALTESFYGRVARLYVIKSTDEKPQERVRLSPADADSFQRRVERLLRDFRGSEAAHGEEYELVATIYRSGDFA